MEKKAKYIWKCKKCGGKMRTLCARPPPSCDHCGYTEFAPLGPESEGEEPEEYSHLSTLIHRVERQEENLSQRDELDRATVSHRLANPLTNIIEYMKMWDDYTEEEQKRAQKILDKYGISYTEDYEQIDNVYQILRQGLPGDELKGDMLDYGERDHCIRCGRKLTAEKSRKRGIGPVCMRKKLNSVSDVVDKSKFWETVEEVSGVEIGEETDG